MRTDEEGRVSRVKSQMGQAVTGQETTRSAESFGTQIIAMFQNDVEFCHARLAICSGKPGSAGERVLQKVSFGPINVFFVARAKTQTLAQPRLASTRDEPPKTKTRKTPSARAVLALWRGEVVQNNEPSVVDYQPSLENSRRSSCWQCMLSSGERVVTDDDQSAPTCDIAIHTPARKATNAT
jgi:hypothetical protein